MLGAGHIRLSQIVAKNRFPSDATNIVVVGLIVVADTAIVEVQVPGVVAIILGRRPIVGGLNTW